VAERLWIGIREPLTLKGKGDSAILPPWAGSVKPRFIQPGDALDVFVRYAINSAVGFETAATAILCAAGLTARQPAQPPA
jgi:hypothetical protein